MDELQAEIARLKSWEFEARPMPEMSELPVLAQIAANYAPGAVSPMETMLVDVKYSKKDHYCLQVRGNSMRPNILEGDIVVVQAVQYALEAFDEERGPADKNFWKGLHRTVVCAIVDDDDPILKRMMVSDRKDTGFKIVLRSDNAAAGDVEVNRDTRLRVVGVARQVMRDPKNTL